MLQLNLPQYNFRIKNENEKTYIFDSQRKKHVILTPEEWVRQNFIQFLIQDRGFPSAYIAIEKELILNGLKKRCDAVVYNENAEPYIIIEFKAPNIPITQKTFDQVAVYNAKLKVKIFMISNGIEHYCCKIDYENSKYNYFREIPTFPIENQ
jgi:hypothetical protein